MEIRTKKPYALTRAERQQISMLHFKSGLMYSSFLDSLRGGGRNFWVLLATDDKKVLAWALLKRTSGFSFMIYVRVDRRRKGIGGRLFRRATTIAKRWGERSIRVFAYNENSRSFFNSLLETGQEPLVPLGPGQVLFAQDVRF